MILLFLFKRKGLAENFWELRPIFVLEQTHLVRYGFASFTWICHGFYFISITIILCQKVIPFFGLVLIIWLECPFLLVVLYLLILLGILFLFCNFDHMSVIYNLLGCFIIYSVKQGKTKWTKFSTFSCYLTDESWFKRFILVCVETVKKS